MLKGLSIEAIHALFIESSAKVCTDTRKIEKGSMFFALKGDNFNANEFAKQALESGCLYAVVDEEKYADHERCILVKDCLTTLQQLATEHRRKFNIPVLAITGSNGKTTNKELIHAVLSRKFNTIATIGNLNNHIGVPLTLLRLNAETEFAIIEMGANHQGEIDALCNIAEPGFGMITNIGKAHLEGFGGEEGVKKGKGELYRYVKKQGGKIFINGDDEVLNVLGFENDKITYGCRKLYDVIGKDVTSGENVSLKYTTRYGEKDWNKINSIQTQIIGTYNFINCLAAACVGNYFKVDESKIAEALANYLPNMNRSQLLKTERNSLILDAYNANPDSMRAAINNFAAYKAAKKWLLLGDMFELGDYAAKEHQNVVQLLRDHKFENVALVGREFSALDAAPFNTFTSTDECRDFLQTQAISGATILIKGSRGMKMETLKDAL